MVFGNIAVEIGSTYKLGICGITEVNFIKLWTDSLPGLLAFSTMAMDYTTQIYHFWLHEEPIL